MGTIRANALTSTASGEVTTGDQRPAAAFDTYSTEGPLCPYCARQYTADEGFYYDESNYTSQECDGCGKTFSVSVFTQTSWTCEEME